MTPIAEQCEWLEADGLGGFAMGTTALVRTRRYHGLLLVADDPPEQRVMLVNGVEAWIDSSRGRLALSAQRYAPDVLHPDGASAIRSFEARPWPRWKLEPAPGVGIECELFARRGLPLVVLRWTIELPLPDATLSVRLLCSGRDFHALQRENSSFGFEPEFESERVTFRPYPDRRAFHVWFSGRYAHAPIWYRQFVYAEERDRQLDHLEDLASPGVFSWPLDAGPAVLVLGADCDAVRALGRRSAAVLATELAAAERERRSSFRTPIERAADQFLVERPGGIGVIAGYPWFGEWGRDTFIALRGLCLATGRLAEARAALLGWADAVTEDGMLANRLAASGGEHEYNSVDAALWYVVVVGELLAEPRAAAVLDARDRERLAKSVSAIVAGHLRGCRHGIVVDHDGLLRAGEPGVQLTWMDAKVGDWVVTPRSGKPVEIQALWINALAVAETLALDAGPEIAELRARALASFAERFWYEPGGYLYDVVDVDHVPGAVDATLRPNQLFALGGLPVPLLSGERARRAVERVVERLWTPAGLRSLAPDHPSYAGRYEGGVRERDGVYHQGTVWPWLTGALIDAWIASGAGSRSEAASRFLAPFSRLLGQPGLGHVAEIADGDPPHTPRGCPFQAWSLGELIRSQRRLAS